MLSRKDFCGALRRMKKLSDEQLLIDKFPVGSPESVDSRLLRHGLSVSAFSMLEHYMNGVFERLFAETAKAPLDFSGFPDKLKNLFTVDAIAGLSNAIKFRETTDR